MHNTLKFFILFICVIMIFGCEEKHQIGYEIEAIHQETEFYSINGEKIILDGETEGVLQFNRIIEEEVKEWQEDFLLRVESSCDGEKPALQFRNIVSYNENDIFSVVTEKYTFITGLHGNTWQTARVFDKNGDKIIKLQDLFNETNYRKMLNEKISEIIAENPEEYHDLWEVPVVDEKCEDKFYINSGKLVIFYEPYELSYYARGVVEFNIPVEEIRGYIKEEYLQRMGMLRNVTYRPV